VGDDPGQTLTFGASVEGNLNHLWWKMPAREDDSWLAQIDVMRRAAASSSAAPTAAAPSTKLTLKFKDHIEEALSNRPSDKAEPA
jgi:hypothetical protein